MKLSDFKDQFFQVIIDGEFEAVANAASTPDQASLFFIEDKTYIDRVFSKPQVSCIICKSEMVDVIKQTKDGVGIAVSDNPRTALYELHNWLAENSMEYRNQYTETVIGDNCRIDGTVIIPKVGVIIGNNVEIGPYTVLHEGVEIGDNVRIMANSVIGGENFIPFFDRNGNRNQLLQIGKLIVSEHVQIGYNTYVMRGTFPYDKTIIGKYTMIESGVEVSHNCKIGDNSVLHGQCHACGNSSIGSGVRIGPKSIVSNRKSIGDKAEIDIGSVVVSDVKTGQRVSGNWAIDHDRFLKWHMKKLRK